MQIPSELTAARSAEQRLLREIGRFGYSEASRFAIKLAVEEGLNNAIKHGNRLDSTKAVTMYFDVDENRAIIRIVDQGPGFDLNAVPDPTADENLEKPSGRGIMLMKAYMDEVHYEPPGNTLYMMKRNS